MISNIIKNAAKTKKLIVVIRTNSSESVLTVNAPADTVHHYDYLDSLTVTAVAGASYHEHGIIRGKAKLSQGHIEVEQGAKVSEVAVVNVPDGQTAKVTAKEETLVSVDATSSSKTSVVAESENVYVSGVSADKISGSKASSVELPQVVTSESELTSAIAASKPYIQLGASFAVAKSFAINYKSLLDFNGFVVTTSFVGTSNDDFVAAVNAMNPDFAYVNNPFILNTGSLTITDSKTNGGVTSANNLVVLNEGELTVNGGEFKSTASLHKYYSGEGTTEEQDDYMAALGIKRGVIHNTSNGKCVINDCSLLTPCDYGVLNRGDMTINGGSFTSTSNSQNGTAYGYCVTSSNGKIVINGGNVLGQHGAISINGGNAIINNVHSETQKGEKAKGYYRALYVAGEVGVAGVEVNGGYFKSYNLEALLTGNKNDGGVGALAMTTINGGTFINGLGGTNPSVKVSGGKAGNNYGIGMMTINAGSFSSNVTGANGVKTCTQVGDLWVVNK